MGVLPHGDEDVADQTAGDAILAAQARAVGGDVLARIDVVGFEERLGRDLAVRPRAGLVLALLLHVRASILKTPSAKLFWLWRLMRLEGVGDFGFVRGDDFVGGWDRRAAERLVGAADVAFDGDPLARQVRAEGVREERTGVDDRLALEIHRPGRRADDEEIAVVLAIDIRRAASPVLHCTCTFTSRVGGVTLYVTGQPSSVGLIVRSMQLLLKFRPEMGAAYRSVM